MKLKNARRTDYGWQFYTRIQGELVTEHFTFKELGGPAPTPAAVRDWKLKQDAARRIGMVDPAAGDTTTFADDVAAYLAQVRTMPTYRWRHDDLTRWLDALGTTRARRTITPAVIRTQLEAWRSAGYAASTVNHRRTALMHLWTVLDGKSAPNPARDVPRYSEPIRPPAALSPAAIKAIVAAMPAGRTKARIVLMAWTGWPQAQIARLEPDDITWKRSVFIRGRRKGRGVAGVYLPLLPEAWTALRRFVALQCWGPFSTGGMRKVFRDAAERVAQDPKTPKAIRQEVRDVTPYQLRHSFGTLIAGITQDDRAVQTLMIHKDIRQTHRYTGATVDVRAAAAVQQVARKVASRSKSSKRP